MDSVSELRQRRKEEDGSQSSSGQSFSKKLEKLDFYPKIGDDYVVKTESGGYGIFEFENKCDSVVSLISAILIIILFISELNNFLTVRREDKIMIDHTINEKLQINFNISTYEIPCHGTCFLCIGVEITSRCCNRCYGHFRSAADGSCFQNCEDRLGQKPQAYQHCSIFHSC